MLNDSAHIAYGTAKSYVQSAFVLMNSPDRLQLSDDLTFFHPFHMLIGFAVELYLKAFLLHAGMSERELKSRTYGHNLEALHAAAEKQGLSVVGQDQLVTLLAEEHRNFGFRYPQVGARYPLPSLNVLFLHLSTLDLAVDAATGASISRGGTPSGIWRLADDKALWRLPAQ